jgi:acyl carrier protein
MSQRTLESIFVESLNIPLEQVADSLSYRSLPQWDSISHMALVAALEKEFGIFMETQDVIDMSSVAKAREILRKYGVAC